MNNIKDLFAWNTDVKEKGKEIIELNEAKKYTTKKELPLTHVFDEDLSVKENKRLVVEHNKNVKNSKKYTKDILREKNDELHALMLDQLESDYPIFNRRQLEYVFYGIIYDTSTYYWWQEVTDKLDFVVDLMDLGN